MRALQPPRHALQGPACSRCTYARQPMCQIMRIRIVQNGSKRAGDSKVEVGVGSGRSADCVVWGERALKARIPRTPSSLPHPAAGSMHIRGLCGAIWQLVAGDGAPADAGRVPVAANVTATAMGRVAAAAARWRPRVSERICASESRNGQKCVHSNAMV